MKRILIATDSFPPRWDGISRFLNEIIPRLSKKYRITIIAPDFSGEYEGYKEVKIVRVPILPWKFGDYFPSKPSYQKIKELVRNSDIVWAQTIGPIGALAIIAAKRQRKSILAYIHSVEWELVPKSIHPGGLIDGLINLGTRLFARYLYNKCGLLLLPSVEIAEIFEVNRIRVSKKVVHLGTDSSKFVPPKSKQEAKKAVGLAQEKIVVGFAGRIGKEKDLVTLLRAFKRLEKKHNIHLLIVGQDIGGVTEMFKSQPNVTVVGTVNNIVPYLQAMDIYVLPSLTETSSLSTMEAMSCGVPVIVTKVGYVKVYVQHGKNGLFFPKENAFTLSKRLEYLIADRAVRERMGQNARKTIQERFSWEKTVEELEKVLEIF